MIIFFLASNINRKVTIWWKLNTPGNSTICIVNKILQFAINWNWNFVALYEKHIKWKKEEKTIICYDWCRVWIILIWEFLKAKMKHRNISIHAFWSDMKCDTFAQFFLSFFSLARCNNSTVDDLFSSLSLRCFDQISWTNNQSLNICFLKVFN